MERYFVPDFLATHGAPRNPAAQEMPGNTQLPGKGLAPVADPACEWLEIAAEQGGAEAQLQFATCLESGAGVARNTPAAMVWYEKAATQGLRDAQRILGIRYLAGAAGPAREETGLDWLRQAAEQGDEFAKTLVDFHAGMRESRPIETMRLCHQKSVADLDDGMAASEAVVAAVQARCVAALDAWIKVRFPQTSLHGLQSLREGARAAERLDVEASLLAWRAHATPSAR